MLSTLYADTPKDVCKRWSKKDKRFINTERPMVIKEYNSQMGGVDMADRFNSYCPMRSRTKKWTIRTISHMFDMAISNAWISYKSDKKEQGEVAQNIHQLRSFKMTLGESLIDRAGRNDQNSSSSEDEEENPSRDRKGRLKPLPIPNVNRKTKHVPLVDKAQHKCRKPGCKLLSRIKCKKCGIFLCLNANRNCYEEFHS